MTASGLASLPAIDAAPSKDEQVYERLRRAMVAGEIRPGQELAVASVALQLGVSRNPVMRACQRLIGEGFLDKNARRNIVVAPLSEQRVVEEFAVLDTLETIAARHAAQRQDAAVLRALRKHNALLAQSSATERASVSRINQRFHEALWNGLGSPYARTLAGLTWDHLEAARHAAVAHSPWDQQRSVREHDAIITAIAAGNPEAAAAAVLEHRGRTIERVVAALRGARP